MSDSSTRNQITSDYIFQEHGESVTIENVRSCGAVSDIVRSTLGPNGRAKLLVSQTFSVNNDYEVTEDGATILDELPIEDPRAELLVTAAQSQKKNFGDGTTTVAVLVGELLREAAELHETGIHPLTIVSGLESVRQQIRTILDDISVDIQTEDDVRAIASTAMGGNVEDDEREMLSDIVYQAFERVGRNDFTRDMIKISRIGGADIIDSKIVDGILLDKEPTRSDMPTTLEDANIALIHGSIQERELNDANLEIGTFEEYRAHFEAEDETVNEAVDAALEAGADVVFLSAFLDDRPQKILADAGVLWVRQLDSTDLRLIGRATGGTLVSEATELTPETLGVADRITQERFESGPRFRIERDGSKTATIVLRARTENVLDELERTVEDAVKAVETAAESGRGVWGGGATEAEISGCLRENATSVKGREQLAIEAVAGAFEEIPTILATNAGVNPIDRIVELRNEHDVGNTSFGVDQAGNVRSMREEGILEPLGMKREAIETAIDIAIRILRIDGVIQTEPLSKEEKDMLAERIDRGEGKEEAIRNIREQ